MEHPATVWHKPQWEFTRPVLGTWRKVGEELDESLNRGHVDGGEHHESDIGLGMLSLR